MSKNILRIFAAFIISFGAVILIFIVVTPKKDLQMLSPIANDLKETIQKVQAPKQEIPKSDLAQKDTVNILLLGIDRRSKAEMGYRSDIMILLSINTKDHKVLLTSVPRDLWVTGVGRINALYVQKGFEGMRDKFEEITGQKADRYILTDFGDFSWVVDAMDGVNINVDNTFTDTEYPVDATLGYQTVTFVKGTEKLTGVRALIYSRSRHGNNGEGSDFMRMRRQHKILAGMIPAVLNPKSIFNPMIVENAFKTITTAKMETNLSLDDVKFLWDFYKDKDKYTIDDLYLDSNYIFNPPMSEYGGAWVLAPVNGTFLPFHKAVNDKLFAAPETTTQTK